MELRNRGMAVLVLFGFAVGSTLAAERREVENLCPNPGFEECLPTNRTIPAGWDVFLDTNPKIELVREVKRNGEQSLRISARGRSKAHQCLLVSLPVTGGDRYTFSAYLRSDTNDRFGKGAEGILAIEWEDEEGAEIFRESSKAWDQNLSRIRWVKFQVKKKKAPKDAVKAYFVIHLSEPKGPGKGSVFIDDVSIVRK